MFTFDTNALIYYLAGRPELLKFVRENRDAVFFLPTIVVVEFLSYPLLDPKTATLFERLLKDFVIVNLDLGLAQFAGQIRKHHKMKTMDAIIAASARATNSVLITYNAGDFQKVKGLTILSP